MTSASCIEFRRLTTEDLPTVHHWLNTTPEVLEHFGHGKTKTYDEVVVHYGRYINGEMPTTAYIILCDGIPIGYIQTYLWRDYPEYAEYLELEEEAASLDVFIGHPDYLHRGLGSGILREFLREIVFTDDRAQSCVIVPEDVNKSALRAYEKAGFKKVRVIDHPEEPGPICVMRVSRGEFFSTKQAYLPKL